MVRFRMLGRDINSNPTQYRTWVVPNTPDLEGDLYTGLKSGSNDFVDISAYAVTDPNAVVDFILPLPDRWRPPEQDILSDFPIRKVLPDPIEDSHFAIIDGYAYLFGGKITDKIYRADINNPADWVDTGARMPTPIYGAQLAIVADYIYLFGGSKGDGYMDGYTIIDGYEQNVLDTIYSAPISNPLSWTNLGSKLPRKLYYSSLGMSDGYLYLFGGKDPTGVTDVIFSSTYSNPTVWEDTSSHLPTKVYGSTIAQIQGFWYLFGGVSITHLPTTNILKAAVDNSTSWSIAGNLPYATSFPLFLAKGNDGYLIGPMIGSTFTGFTPIIQCNLSNPLSWLDRGFTVPGVVSNSHVGIIYDRFWIFGGSGSSVMYACNQNLKYNYTSLAAIEYGQTTRIGLPATDNLHNPYEALCFPYWKSNYQF